MKAKELYEQMQHQSKNPSTGRTRISDFALDVVFGRYEGAVRGVQHFDNLTTAQEVQAIILLDIARSLRILSSK